MKNENSNTKKFFWRKTLIDTYYLIKEEIRLDRSYFWGYRVKTYRRYWKEWKEEFILNGYDETPPRESVCKLSLDEAKIALEKYISPPISKQDKQTLEKVVAKFDQNGKEIMSAFI